MAKKDKQDVVDSVVDTVTDIADDVPEQDDVVNTVEDEVQFDPGKLSKDAMNFANELDRVSADAAQASNRIHADRQIVLNICSNPSTPGAAERLAELKAKYK